MSADPTTSTFVGIVLVPVASIALSVPLIRRTIPRNAWYGFRTPKTLSSDGVWYEANHIGGIYFLVAGVIQLVALSALLMFVPAGDVELFATCGLAALVVPLLIAIV